MIRLVTRTSKACIAHTSIRADILDSQRNPNADSLASRFFTTGKLGKNLAATWSECHKHVRITVCKLTLQAVRCVEADVKEGDAPSKLTARNLAKASRRSLRKLVRTTLVKRWP